jgi:hypothetical protein
LDLGAAFVVGAGCGFDLAFGFVADFGFGIAFGFGVAFGFDAAFGFSVAFGFGLVATVNSFLLIFRTERNISLQCDFECQEFLAISA